MSSKTRPDQCFNVTEAGTLGLASRTIAPVRRYRPGLCGDLPVISLRCFFLEFMYR